MRPLLQVEGVTKRYGAMIAVNEVDLSVTKGRIHCIIGPNGAGKTSFFNVLSRVSPATSGTILFQGKDITEVPLHKVAGLGIGRAFQRTQIFPELSTVENVRLAAQSRGPKRLHPLRLPTKRDANSATAMEVLEIIGLVQRAQDKAVVLSHGEQRALDVGIALARRPTLLLLDEPTAGMSAAEVHTMTNLITRLRDSLGVTILLVEHNINLVMSISDIITVFHRGSVLAEDTPDAIKSNESVRLAYLGGSVDA